VSAGEARERRDEARNLVGQGIDPSHARQQRAEAAQPVGSKRTRCASGAASPQTPAPSSGVDHRADGYLRARAAPYPARRVQSANGAAKV